MGVEGDLIGCQGSPLRKGVHCAMNVGHHLWTEGGHVRPEPAGYVGAGVMPWDSSTGRWSSQRQWVGKGGS